MQKFIKKNGNEETFDVRKIHRGIVQAMKSGSGVYHKNLAEMIASEAEAKFSKKEEINATEVDKFVLNRLIEYGQTLTAHAYERFKTVKSYQKVDELIDNDIYGIVDGTNDKVKTENANKDARRASTQRDLIAGVVSRSYSERKIMPPHLLAAHNEGLIHIHDTDYMVNHIHNCQLIDMKDMLQNGTVINGKMIRKPKSFQTACTVATQISLSVSSGQYGGQTFSTAHLAPFVRISYEKYLKSFLEEGINEDEAKKLADKFTRQEVKSGVQTIQFQENTFSSTNGQTPFVSIFMYLNEEPEFIKENAMIIEEMLKLRYEGMENEYGVRVTPSFPKLLYVLDENNIHEDSEYKWLTDLAVKCSAKRMNPDYISAKVMKEVYEGNVFGCMGCVDGSSIIRIQYDDTIIEDEFEKIYEFLSTKFNEKPQSEGNINKIIELDGVKIFDSNLNDFTLCKSIIRNIQDDWRIVVLSDNKILKCTSNHPWTLVDSDEVEAKNLQVGDKVYVENGEIVEITKIISYNETNAAYDVTTESEHFTVNGIYTHNCRSFLAPWREDSIEPIMDDVEFELE